MSVRLTSRVLLPHYHNIKHRKARVDAQKQATFQKLSRDVYAVIKSRNGEKDPSKNPRLARALEAARKASMPRQRIERAISTVEKDSSISDTVLFEGVFPDGVGVLVRATAARRNAVAGEVRSLMSHAGGELGKASWMFTERHTVLLRDIDKQYVDDIIMFGIDQGADDVILIDDESIEFLCSTAKERDEVRRALTEKFCFLDTAILLALQHVDPKVFVAISDEAATRFERLLSALNDHADVLDVTPSSRDTTK
ncbi:putative transcriptional regulatory protein [Gracilariopsis chorda]|uniref:Putative transcriptional regulatory protein n=1 Tax=Gracilariopsis chorda TaxID=448386 RepID=A0A2V3IIA0_9FLOR|nr:putative transcriptional regulatory protein [Gracilariopsis chorda]|eukprot:PXF41816.1 putative transcriptional regulatory protein [Gracilariopsis chorda]